MLSGEQLLFERHLAGRLPGQIIARGGVNDGLKSWMDGMESDFGLEMGESL